MKRTNNARPAFIYVLKDPTDSQIRYVGKTEKTLETRLSGHISEAKRRKVLCHKNNWVYSLLLKGLRPIIQLIETVPYDQDWQEREKYWIKYYRELGYDLTNSTDGGIGTSGWTSFKKGIIKPRDGKPVAQYDSESGSFIREWESIISASRELGIANSSISLCCKGKIKTAGGFIWVFADYELEIIEKSHPPINNSKLCWIPGITRKKMPDFRIVKKLR
jgi:hypothetical protein